MHTCTYWVITYPFVIRCNNRITSSCNNRNEHFQYRPTLIDTILLSNVSQYGNNYIVASTCAYVHYVSLCVCVVMCVFACVFACVFMHASVSVSVCLCM